MIFTSEQPVTEDEATLLDVQESLREDTVLSAAAGKKQQRERLVVHERRTLTALIRDLP